MPLRNAIALDHIHAAGGYVEQGVHQRIGQQVDFIHIQNAAMRTGDQSWQELHLPVTQNIFQIERSYQLLQTGRQGQADERRIWQQGCQRAGCGGLGSAARAADQYAAYAGINRCQQQRLPQLGIALQRGKRKSVLAGGLQCRRAA